MTKTALLIPGNNEQIMAGYAANPDRYKPLMDGLANRGFEVYGIEVDWSAEYGQWVAGAQQQIDALEVNPDETSLVGFSWGSLIALGVSQSLPLRTLSMGSLSPHGGRGSLDRLREWQIAKGYEPSEYTPQRRATFEALDVGAMALGNKAANTVIVYGSEESEVLRERCQSVASLTPGVVEIEVPGARHEVDNASYARALVVHTAESLEF